MGRVFEWKEKWWVMSEGGKCILFWAKKEGGTTFLLFCGVALKTSWQDFPFLVNISSTPFGEVLANLFQPLGPRAARNSLAKINIP